MALLWYTNNEFVGNERRQQGLVTRSENYDQGVRINATRQEWISD